MLKEAFVIVIYVLLKEKLANSEQYRWLEMNFPDTFIPRTITKEPPEMLLINEKTLFDACEKLVFILTLRMYI